MNLYTLVSERGTMEGRGDQTVPVGALLTLIGGRRLSPAQRRIAQYLLDHMPGSAFLSSVALAQRAGVSQPTVTRFAAALGFSGYPALREALRIIALEPVVNVGPGLSHKGAAPRARRREPSRRSSHFRRGRGRLRPGPVRLT
jgi:hypothetical protein